MMAGSIVPRDRYQLLRRFSAYYPSAQYIVDTIQYKLNEEFEARMPRGRLLTAMRQYAVDQCKIDLQTTLEMPSDVLFAALALRAGLSTVIRLVMAWDTEAQRRWPLIVCELVGAHLRYHCDSLFCYCDDDDDMACCNVCGGTYCSKCRRDQHHGNGCSYVKFLLTEGPPDVHRTSNLTGSQLDHCVRLGIMDDVYCYLDERYAFGFSGLLMTWAFWAWKREVSITKIRAYVCRASFDGANYCISSNASGTEIVQLRFMELGTQRRPASSYDPQRRLLEDMKSVLALFADPNHMCARRYIFIDDDDVYKQILAIAGDKELICRFIPASPAIPSTRKQPAHRLVNRRLYE